MCGYWEGAGIDSLTGTVITSERESVKFLSLNPGIFTDLLKPILLYRNIYYPAAIGNISDH